MCKIKIRLNDIEEIRTFFKNVSRFEDDVDVISGRYIIDAKSLLGVMSLDLSNPVYVTLNSDDELLNSTFRAIMRQYEVE